MAKKTTKKKGSKKKAKKKTPKKTAPKAPAPETPASETPAAKAPVKGPVVENTSTPTAVADVPKSSKKFHSIPDRIKYKAGMQIPSNLKIPDLDNVISVYEGATWYRFKLKNHKKIVVKK